MGLTIKSQIKTDTGDTITTDAYLWANFHTGTMEIDGKVPCDLHIFRSEADKDAGLKEIICVDANNKPYRYPTLQFSPDDTVKASGVTKMSHVIAYFYTKLAEELTTTRGWTF